jgi:FAD:protein FMN transferase
VFAAVEAECTRFDAGSDLMRANAAGEDWQPVGRYCFAAIVEAAAAHRITAGMFDPRVLRTLCALGYDHSVPFASGALSLGSRPPAGHPPREPWSPAFDETGGLVRVGSEPIDLGGIGKGLAVRWAAQELTTRFRSFVIDAGGDCYLAGDGPDGDGWHVGVEDPRGGAQPVAVLAVRDAGCATSSIRLRRWTVGGTPVHHLVDPRTGLPGGAGLLSVTVVARDPAEAEVWSKVLFLHGAAGIAAAAHTRELAALWVTDDGTVATSHAVQPLLIWRAA